MIRTIKVDWLAFSYPREFDAVALDLAVRSGFSIERIGSSRWHKEKWEVKSLCGERKFHVFLKPRTSAGKPQVEMGGSWLCDSQVEREALELMRACDGIPNRLDIAWDFRQENHGETDHWRDLDLIEPKRSQKTTIFHDEYREWTGKAFGYGVGSECCLRVYDKGKESGTEEQNLGWWWRVEVMIRGNTLKAQDIIKDCVGAYRLGEVFLKSRWTGFPDWFGLDWLLGIKPAPRPRGIATYEGAVVYHQRIIAKHQRCLAEIESLLEGACINGSQVSSRGETPCSEGPEGGGLCQSGDSRG